MESLLAATEFYGELGLTGEIKPIRGVLLAAAQAMRESRRVVVPSGNLDEARLVAPGGTVGVAHLLAVREHLAAGQNRETSSETPETPAAPSPAPRRKLDLSDVRGQAIAKRALFVAAAGAHGILLVGPPGTGKSMLAQRLPDLLPQLESNEALDVATIASVSARGFMAGDYGRRPFRSPHHSASTSAIIGGGPQARPGEVSLAHRGVLFLDELPEFNRGVLESLREPLESGVVAISRAALQVEYPARFQLVAAMNPCPCGYLGDSSGRCRCAPPDIARYRARISGPLLDRIDLRVEVPAVTSEELLGEVHDVEGMDSAGAARRVSAARQRQHLRAGKLNSELSGSETHAYCPLDRQCRQLLAHARLRLNLSARAIHRVLRVARTIADLDTLVGAPQAVEINTAHLAEALQLRRAVE